MFVGFVGHRAVEPGLVPTRCRPADRDCLACRRLLSPPHPGSKFTHVKSPRPTQFRRTRDLSAGRHRLQLAKLQPGDQQGAVATTAFYLVLDRLLTRSGHRLVSVSPSRTSRRRGSPRAAGWARRASLGACFFEERGRQGRRDLLRKAQEITPASRSGLDPPTSPGRNAETGCDSALYPCSLLFPPKLI
jgi:hypothetical protein